LRRDESYREQLLQLGRQFHGQLNLAETSYAVANDGRRVIGCDRLSVLVCAGGRGCRLLAASGVGRVERRTTAARDLEALAELVRRTNEPAYYADGQSDAIAPVAEALGHYAETSHARQIAVMAIRSPNAGQGSEQAHPPYSLPVSAVFVLIAEQFDAQHGELFRPRLADVADVAASALTNALEVHRLPLGWLLRPVGALKERLTASWPRYLFAASGVVAAVVALCIVPADFNIETAGTLQPAVRRDVFAPRSGLVDQVLVEHGADVAAGQPLARLRDPLLELELKRVHGELETAERQLDAVRATKTSRAVRDGDPIDVYRLSAEERELDQQITNLRRELELLSAEREKLVVASPIAGRVLTWDVAHRLPARPVERGEVILAVADLSADWQLELDVPDDQIGHVLAAQRELKPDLPVRFRLSSDDRRQHVGRVAEVSSTADVKLTPGATPAPTVRVNVAFDALEMGETMRRELRPGVSARAQIACGRRPLGYVWLHDIWDAVMGWIRF
jgi:multidrug efflux pump subunit AcrA (membrane-fusion protein)